MRVLQQARAYFAAGMLAVLAGCSGGAPTAVNPNAQVAQANEYAGPAALSADVLAFKINLWANIEASDRCGGCHKAGGQAPTFARADDINLAYSAALQVVNLTQPDQSVMVQKVAGGHNCWLASAQACADILTTWIRNWAGGATGGGTQIQLVAPPDKTVGATKTFPPSSALFGSTVYPLLQQFCSRCHSPGAVTPQSPFFASPNVDEAYAAAQAKINLDVPANSRFVVRLRDEFHNCWPPSPGAAVDCAVSADRMLTAIQNFIGLIQVMPVDPNLVLSKALGLYDGTIASGQNRYDTNLIARYQFKEGSGTTAFDTSGVDPAADLTLTGDVSFVGGWGIAFGANGGKAQASTATSGKLYTRIGATGQYSVELWVTPANVTQQDAYIASYSGSATMRNFTVGQHGYQYEVYQRGAATDGNGMPVLQTAAANRNAQAALQHLVVTFDPVNGRRIYVNGNYTGDVDAQKGGAIANWDNTFAFLLGNETSSNRKWQGVVKFAALYDHALSLAQVQQNFAAGVGEKYFLLFNVSQLTGMNQNYIEMEVSRFDSYSYLFNRPTFISLDKTAQPGNIPIQGIRIGINGAEASIGQAYIPLNVTVSNASYSAADGQLLSAIGTVIALQKGPDSDQFFLSFERIGALSDVHTEAPPAPAGTPPDVASPDIGVRVFSEINAALSAITGVPTSNALVSQVYTSVQQQLPNTTDIQSIAASHQVAISQLAMQYCDQLVESPALAAAFFQGLSLSGPPATVFGSAAGKSLLINPLLNNGLGINLASQPSPGEVSAELSTLIDSLASCGASCDPTRTKTITKAACAAVLGSAAVLIK